MPITPAVTVPAPEPLGRRYGLLTAAAGPLDLPSNRVGGGVTYDPVSCGTAHRVPLDCVDQDTPVEKDFDPGDAWVDGAGFVVYATVQCGATGAGDIEGKLLRRLANGTQSAVERELGERLTAAAVAVPAPVTTEASSVIGELEQWLYGSGSGEQAYGNIGYIHAPFRMASYLHKGTLLWTDTAGRVRTRMGSVVVFGDYPDDGGIFITGHTTLWRSADVATSPRAQVLNRTNNNLYMLAEQEWAVAYDCVAGRTTYSLEGMS